MSRKKRSKRSKKAKDKNLSQPHAKAFTFFFKEKETAVSMLEGYLPENIKKKLNFKSLKISKDSFIDKRLKNYFADLLYEIKLKSSQKSALIYILFEHKYWQDWFVCLQLLKYMVRIWELFLKQNKDARYLPVIFPLVLYHGKPQWEISQNFISLFEDPAGFKPYIPDFSFDLQDVSHMADEDIHGSPLLKMILTTFKYIHSPGIRNKLWDIFKLFLELSDKSNISEYLEALVTYLVNSPGKLTEEELQEPVTRIIEEGGADMQTIFEKWIEKGVEKGIDKGKWDVVMNLLRLGISVDIISESTGFTAAQINEFKEKMQDQQVNAAA
jgi:predicted transposase/invertase (TIGR01784 family)